MVRPAKSESVEYEWSNAMDLAGVEEMDHRKIFELQPCLLQSVNKKRIAFAEGGAGRAFFVVNVNVAFVGSQGGVSTGANA